MENWKVGDKVAITQYSSTIGVDTVVQITKGGNIRLSKNNNLFNSNGSMRSAGVWNTTHIIKITDKQYHDYLTTKEIKLKRKKIIEKLNSIQDKDLLSYLQPLDIICNQLHIKD
ncbi:MAG: hypothetical protein J1E81_06075 [Eubacterium sp.]|nr:hypothetical protein [Eubacterium sp.]